jgi:hypothetical protein
VDLRPLFESSLQIVPGLGFQNIDKAIGVAFRHEKQEFIELVD